MGAGDRHDRMTRCGRQRIGRSDAALARNSSGRGSPGKGHERAWPSMGNSERKPATWRALQRREQARSVWLLRAHAHWWPRPGSDVVDLERPRPAIAASPCRSSVGLPRCQTAERIAATASANSAGRLRCRGRVADRADASDAELERIRPRTRCQSFRPSPARLGRRTTDRRLCEERHKIEIMLGFLKPDRRVFAWLNLLARRYVAFVHCSAACLALR